MNKTKPKLFFILGCQRTGTTLMRLILESHSMVKCFDEPQCYEILKNHTELLKSNQKEYWHKTKTIRNQKQREYRENNKDKRNSYQFNRLNNDVNYKILKNLRNRIWHALNNNVKSNKN